MARVGSRRTLLAPRLREVSDTFTRPDSATTLGNTETGQLWTADAGTWGISAGRGYLATVTAQAAASAAACAGDMILRCDVTLSSTAGRADAGLLFRHTDDNNYLLLAVTKSSTNVIKLWKRDAGAFTALASVDPAGLVNGTTYAVRVDCSGNSIRCLVDDVEKFAFTLTGDDATKFGPSKTRVGIRINRAAGAADDGGSRFDNLIVRRA